MRYNINEIEMRKRLEESVDNNSDVGESVNNKIYFNYVIERKNKQKKSYYTQYSIQDKIFENLSAGITTLSQDSTFINRIYDYDTIAYEFENNGIKINNSMDVLVYNIALYMVDCLTTEARIMPFVKFLLSHGLYFKNGVFEAIEDKGKKYLYFANKLLKVNKVFAKAAEFSTRLKNSNY